MYKKFNSFNSCKSIANLNITQSVPVACPGQPLNLTASGASTYSWNTGQNSATISVSPMSFTTYTVTGTSVAGCLNVRSIDISVYPQMNLSITTSESVICSGQSVILTASGANTYSWNTGDNNDSISVNPTLNTDYTVIGTDINGCVDTFTYTQNVSECVGIKNLNNSIISLSVYPIPANENINIELSNIDDKSDYTLNIYSIEGKNVITHKVNFENNKT